MCAGEGDDLRRMRAQKGIRGALLVDATGHGGPTRRALRPFARGPFRERRIAPFDALREGEILLGVFVADPEAGLVGQRGEAHQRVVQLRGCALEEASAPGEKERVAREGVSPTDVRDRAERVTGHLEYAQRRRARRHHVSVAHAARLTRDALSREIVRTAHHLDAGIRRAQFRDAAGVIEVVVRAPDRSESQPARGEEIAHGCRFGRVHDDGVSAPGAHEQISVVVVEEREGKHLQCGVFRGHDGVTIRALPCIANRDIVPCVNGQPSPRLRRFKRVLVAITVASTPLALGVETLMRTQIFPLFLGGQFEEVRVFLEPQMTPVAWAFCGITTLAGFAGLALQKRVLRRALEKLPPERRALPGARERAVLGSFLVAASVPQLASVGSTLLFTFGASLVPVVVGVVIGSSAVLVQASRAVDPA